MRAFHLGQAEAHDILARSRTKASPSREAVDGPLLPTATGDKMFLLVVDDATRYKWCYLLERKDDAEPLLMNLVRRLTTDFKSNGLGVVHLHSDKGGEFLGDELKAFCERRGITQSSTNSYSPEENGIVERANGTVLPRLRALLHATNQTNMLWGEAALHVVDTLNLLPTAPLQGMSPHEALFGKQTSLRHVRTWGAWCTRMYLLSPGRRKRSSSHVLS